MSAKQYILSADLGQAHDFTAISILEEARVTDDEGHIVSETGLDRSPFEPPASTRVVSYVRDETRLVHLQRLKLGVTYPEQIRIIAALFKALPAAEKPPLLAVDFTGVGRPVVQAMREAGLSPVGVTITSGFDENRISRFEWRVPKRNLISNLAVAIESGRLKIAPGLAEAEALVKELVNFKMKISAAGNETFEAWRESIHDDLVLSVAIGLLMAMRQPTPTRVIRGGAIALFRPNGI